MITIPSHPGPLARRLAHLGALALIGASLACKGEAAPAEEEAHPVVNVTTGVVSASPFRETVTAIGTVVPRAGSVALLSAPSPTRVANVLAVTGQMVKKGAPLVEFERAPFEARAAGAEAALQTAELAHTRAQRLVAQGISARKDEEQAASELARAKAEAIAARREAQLARLESPIDGVVTKMTAVLGASVDASQALIEIADPSAVDVVVQITPTEAGRLRVGASVTLSTGQDTEGEVIGTSTVREVAGAVDPDTRAIPVRISGGQMKRTLRIGESVVAEITVAQFDKATVISAAALVPEGEGFKVFVVTEEGAAHERAVTIGGRSKGRVRIASGLRIGEIIVIDGAFGMTDGGKVAGLADADEEEEHGAAPHPDSSKADAKKAGSAKKP